MPFVLRCCGIFERGNGRNIGYMDTTRIVNGQLWCALCFFSYIFPLWVVFVDGGVNMEQVETMLDNPFQ